MEELSEKWGRLLQLAVTLKIPPDIFWQLTPQELVLIYQSHNFHKKEGISVNQLQELMEKFPD